jgi:hypothetical protein
MYTMDVTKSRGQSLPLEVDNRLANEESPLLLRNAMVHYCVHESPPLDTTLSQLNEARTLTPYLFKNHFNYCHSIYAQVSQVVFSTCILYTFLISLKFKETKLKTVLASPTGNKVFSKSYVEIVHKRHLKSRPRLTLYFRNLFHYNLF